MIIGGLFYLLGSQREAECAWRGWLRDLKSSCGGGEIHVFAPNIQKFATSFFCNHHGTCFGSGLVIYLIALYHFICKQAACE